MGFASSVRATAAKQQVQLNRKVMSMATELFTEAVNLSPAKPAAKYAKGEFINNWIAVANGAASGKASGRDMQGAASRASIAALKSSYTFLGQDGYVTLTNNTPYSGLVEYKGWMTEDNARWKNSPPYAPVMGAFIKVVPKFKGGLTW